jgi:hypothetical protein
VCAAAAHFAENYGFPVRIDLIHPVKDLAEWYQFGTLDVCKLILGGLPYVYKLYVFAGVHRRL